MNHKKSNKKQMVSNSKALTVYKDESINMGQFFALRKAFEAVTDNLEFLRDKMEAGNENSVLLKKMYLRSLDLIEQFQDLAMKNGEPDLAINLRLILGFCSETLKNASDSSSPEAITQVLSSLAALRSAFSEDNDSSEVTLH